MDVTSTIQPATLPPRLASRVWALPEPAPTSPSHLPRFVIAPDDVQGTAPYLWVASR
jgi:hypothetical protein